MATAVLDTTLELVFSFFLFITVLRQQICLIGIKPHSHTTWRARGTLHVMVHEFTYSFLPCIVVCEGGRGHW